MIPAALPSLYAIGFGLAAVGFALVGCGGSESIDPADPPLGESERQALACRAPQVLFLNFDGVQVTGASQSCEDARRNCSFLAAANVHAAVSIPPFSGGADAQQQIVALVAEYYHPFNVQVVSARPAAGSYSMVAIGGLPALLNQAPGAAGIAPLDCGNTQDNNISFAFSEKVDNDVAFVGQVAAQEAAHAYGLGHVSDPTDVMYPAAVRGVIGFQDKVMTIPDSSGCGASEQNDVQLLDANVGAACPGGTGGSGGAPPLPPAMTGTGGTSGTGGSAGAGGAAGEADLPGNLPKSRAAGDAGAIVGGCELSAGVRSAPRALMMAVGVWGFGLAWRRRSRHASDYGR